MTPKEDFKADMNETIEFGEGIKESCAQLCENYAKLTGSETEHLYAELIRKTPLNELEFLKCYTH